MANGPSSSASGKAAIIDGKAVAARVTERVAEETRRLKAECGVAPGLAVVLVGDDPASHVYVSSKGRKADELGFHSVQHTLSATTSEEELVALVEGLNGNPEIHGILVQLPLPSHIDTDRVIEAIRPEKDVDGLHPINIGRLASGAGEAMVPCTPAGCMILLRGVLKDGLSGLEAVVIGRSNLVGKPIAQLLLAENCTVTVAHSRTRDLADVVRRADIVVAAVGRQEMVRGDWIKPG
ncbi:MAG: bifunctional methylenetetrahydrofolate dehydrogenase/methenyltetrahydrofolate cyclohydrolase, partial [Bauldia sp.]|nr:bifunctional methylenetetrahydrofolate dehydrogenase/methenyltetrahydrofolate cyclohydrolase [Bauldia sp.]